MTTQVRPELEAAINRLADSVENGHLLSTMGGEDLLNAASERIADLQAQLAQVTAERDGLAEQIEQDRATQRKFDTALVRELKILLEEFPSCGS